MSFLTHQHKKTKAHFQLQNPNNGYRRECPGKTAATVSSSRFTATLKLRAGQPGRNIFPFVLSVTATVRGFCYCEEQWKGIP
jgi:hypothetical protein